MTKNEVVQLFSALNQLGALKGVKMAYGVSRNLTLLKPELESLEKASVPTDEYKKFDELRIEMVKKFAKKEDKGEPVITGNEFELEDKAGMEKAFDELKAEHKEVWDARMKQMEEYNELLKTDSSVVLYKINLSDVPADITVAQLHGISAIISEDIVSPFK